MPFSSRRRSSILVGAVAVALLAAPSLLAQTTPPLQQQQPPRQPTQTGEEGGMPRTQPAEFAATGPRTQPTMMGTPNVWRSTVLPLPRTCPTVYRRKEVRDLTQQEWQRYVAACKALQANGVWDRLVKIHIDYQTPIHNFASFLVWHRYYLKQFELNLQRVDPTVAVPYWNWGFDAQAPETSEVLSAAYFGGNGQGPRRCVPDGAFNDWRPFYPRGRHCLRRDYDLGDALSAWYGPEAINAAITRSRTYDQFRRSLEYPIHGSVHQGLGLDAASMASPNDPLFWALHGYVDKVYVEWQRANPQAGLTYNGPNNDGTRASTRDVLSPWPVTVGQVINHRSLCYEYDDMRPGRVAPQPRRGAAGNTNAQPTGAQPDATGAQGNDQRGWEMLVRRSFAEEAPADVEEAHADVEEIHAEEHPEPSRRRRPNAYTGRPIDVPSDYEEPLDAPPLHPTHRGRANYTAPLPNLDTTDPYTVSYADRQNLLAVRVPRPLPEWWAKMNHVDMDELRNREREYAQVCRAVNQLPTYTSPTALYYRPRALEVLAPKVKTFYAIVNGTRVVPAKGGYSPDAPRRRGGDYRQVVEHVRETIFEQCKSKLTAAVDTFAGGLQRVIGRVVHPVLRTAYPVLAPPRYDEDEDEVCDADYDDDNEDTYVPPRNVERYSPERVRPPPKLVSDNVKGTTVPPPTYRPTGAQPNHAIRAPVPVQRGAYAKRDAGPRTILVDGGDDYDKF